MQPKPNPTNLERIIFKDLYAKQNNTMPKASTRRTTVSRYAPYPGANRRRNVTTVARSGANYSFVPRPFGNPISLGEMKYFESELFSSSLTAPNNWAGTEIDPSTLNTLFVPSPGSGINNRVGRKVEVQKVKLRGNIVVQPQANQTATDAAALIRIIMFMDKQTNGTQAQGEELMSTPANASPYTTICQFQNLANLGRFQVMKDIIVPLQNPTIAYDGTNMEQSGFTVPFSMFHKFKKPVTVHFNSTDGGTVADIVDNSFHVIAMCTSTNLSPLVFYKARTSYKDI